jgi:hypothetical protein
MHNNCLRHVLIALPHSIYLSHCYDFNLRSAATYPPHNHLLFHGYARSQQKYTPCLKYGRGKSINAKVILERKVFRREGNFDTEEKSRRNLSELLTKPCHLKRLKMIWNGGIQP